MYHFRVRSPQLQQLNDLVRYEAIQNFILSTPRLSTLREANKYDEFRFPRIAPVDLGTVMNYAALYRMWSISSSHLSAEH